MRDDLDDQGTRSDVTGIVLVGGRSSRMGTDKAAIVLEGRTLLERAVDALAVVAGEVLVVGGAGPLESIPLERVAAGVRARRVADRVAGRGPLGGIEAGLSEARTPVALAVACDQPYLEPRLLELLVRRALEGAALVVPVFEGAPQWLCAAWRVEALPALQAQLEGRDRAVAAVARALDTRLVTEEEWRAVDPLGRSFVNLNTPADVAAAGDASSGKDRER